MIWDRHCAACGVKLEWRASVYLRFYVKGVGMVYSGSCWPASLESAETGKPIKLCKFCLHSTEVKIIGVGMFDIKEEAKVAVKHEFMYIGNDTQLARREGMWRGFICIHCGLTTTQPIENLQTLSAEDAWCTKGVLKPTEEEVKSGKYDCTIAVSNSMPESEE